MATSARKSIQKPRMRDFDLIVQSACLQLLRLIVPFDVPLFSTSGRRSIASGRRSIDSVRHGRSIDSVRHGRSIDSVRHDRILSRYVAQRSLVQNMGLPSHRVLLTVTASSNRQADTKIWSIAFLLGAARPSYINRRRLINLLGLRISDFHLFELITKLFSSESVHILAEIGPLSPLIRELYLPATRASYRLLC